MEMLLVSGRFPADWSVYGETINALFPASK
jgi:hypothetical protein